MMVERDAAVYAAWALDALDNLSGRGLAPRMGTAALRYDRTHKDIRRAVHPSWADPMAYLTALNSVEELLQVQHLDAPTLEAAVAAHRYISQAVVVDALTQEGAR